jgi:hypothetical protein
MFRLEERINGQWHSVGDHIYRTGLRAMTAARTRTAQHGTSHRVVDLSEEAAAEYVAAGSVSKSHHRYLRCGTLGELDRQANESTERCHQWLSR